MQKINFSLCEFQISNNQFLIFVSVLGAINKNTYHKFENFYQDLVKDKNKVVILSLTKIEYIDSTGLGILVNFEKKCQEKDIILKFASIPPKILHLFQMLGMTSVFDIYETETKALEWVTEKYQLKHSIDYYLNKIHQKENLGNSLSSEKLEVIPNKKTEVAAAKKQPSKYIKIDLQYHCQMLMYDSYTFQINVQNISGIVVPCVKGALVIPPGITINKEKTEATFTITPILIEPKNTIDIYIHTLEETYKKSFPIQIKARLTTILKKNSAVILLLLFLLAKKSIFFSLSSCSIIIIASCCEYYYRKKSNIDSFVKQTFHFLHNLP